MIVLHYDQIGDLTVSIPPELRHLAREAVAELASPELVRATPSGLECHWRVARAVERRLRAIWPQVAASAEANPAYVGQVAEGVGVGR